MDNVVIKYKMDKYWIFRKICLKNIDFFLRLNDKQNYLVERKTIKRLKSFGSRSWIPKCQYYKQK